MNAQNSIRLPTISVKWFLYGDFNYIDSLSESVSYNFSKHRGNASLPVSTILHKTIKETQLISDVCEEFVDSFIEKESIFCNALHDINLKNRLVIIIDETQRFLETQETGPFISVPKKLMDLANKYNTPLELVLRDRIDYNMQESQNPIALVKPNDDMDQYIIFNYEDEQRIAQMLGFTDKYGFCMNKAPMFLSSECVLGYDKKTKEIIIIIKKEIIKTDIYIGSLHWLDNNPPQKPIISAKFEISSMDNDLRYLKDVIGVDPTYYRGPKSIPSSSLKANPEWGKRNSFVYKTKKIKTRNINDICEAFLSIFNNKEEAILKEKTKFNLSYYFNITIEMPKYTQEPILRLSNEIMAFASKIDMPININLAEQYYN